jgi:hypothetical protein
MITSTPTVRNVGIFSTTPIRGYFWGEHFDCDSN